MPQDDQPIPASPEIFLHQTTQLRQTKKSHCSHFAGTDEELARLVRENFGKATRGKFPDTLIVPVPPEGFFAKVSIGNFSAGVPKPPAKSVVVILWSREKMQSETTTELPQGKWGIVSIEAS
ncbi:MAG: hypothetical protein PHZ04_01540 [Patescibacteria group bacterium]|nr:hypothetical protein [Patescibacteria group bacterium]MDD5294778.1 hypothetical protein [Patescibacteria group bacterium]MDD5554926.1 hypothetical protein [Patescibacteria group bacterium]